MEPNKYRPPPILAPKPSPLYTSALRTSPAPPSFCSPMLAFVGGLALGLGIERLVRGRARPAGTSGRDGDTSPQRSIAELKRQLRANWWLNDEEAIAPEFWAAYGRVFSSPACVRVTPLLASPALKAQSGNAAGVYLKVSGWSLRTEADHGIF